MGKPSLLPGIQSEEVTKLAERRMFSKTVISSARFLRMPPTSRLLYFDLGMEADDDGCVEAFGVMRKTGATERKESRKRSIEENAPEHEKITGGQYGKEYFATNK